MALRLRRGTALERLTIVPAAGELIYTTDTKKLYIGDGAITGGNEVNTEIKGLLADDLYLSIYKLLGSGLELDGSTGNISANLITGDLIGSVYADDSSKIIDGLSGKVVGPIRISVNDIEILGGNAGQVLATDGAGNLTWTAGGSGGSSTLAGLNDVSVGSLTTNEVLTWSGSAWVNSPVTPSGHFVGDMSGSVFADDSTKIIDGINGSIHGMLYASDIVPENDDINFGNISSPIKTITFDFGLGDPTSIELRTIATSSGDYAVPKILLKAYGDTTDPESCTQLGTGDMLSAIVQNIQNPTGNGGESLLTTALIHTVDPAGSVTASYASGKFYFINSNGPDWPNDVSYLSFDSRGYLGVNKLNATEVLDVDGNGKFSGFVQFGSLSATDRSGLTPVNGMVIYNSTANRFQGFQGGGWINLDDGTNAT